MPVSLSDFLMFVLNLLFELSNFPFLFSGQRKAKYFPPDELMSKLSTCLECLEEREMKPSGKSSGPCAKRPPCHPSGNIKKSEGAQLRDTPKPLLVTKWVDYSNKYGFGAQLSDGSVTVRFNDCSKIALSPGKR